MTLEYQLSSSTFSVYYIVQLSELTVPRHRNLKGTISVLSVYQWIIGDSITS